MRRTARPRTDAATLGIIAPTDRCLLLRASQTSTEAHAFQELTALRARRCLSTAKREVTRMQACAIIALTALLDIIVQQKRKMPPSVREELIVRAKRDWLSNFLVEMGLSTIRQVNDTTHNCRDKIRILFHQTKFLLIVQVHISCIVPQREYNINCLRICVMRIRSISKLSFTSYVKITLSFEEISAIVDKTITLAYLLSGQTNVSACQLCTKGHYCPRTGMAEPAGLCSPGYWCSLGSWSAEPIIVGNDTGLLGCQCPASSRGGPCMPGYYCPQGASRPTACDPGKYCANWTLSAPMGFCSAGYYCNSTASSDTPMDGVTGNRCPKGHYCPEGIDFANFVTSSSFSSV